MSTLTVTNIKATGETASRAVSGVAAAWVNFNGQGTIAVRDSVNVASLTDNGAGDYTVNFTNSFGNQSYSTVFSATIYNIAYPRNCGLTSVSDIQVSSSRFIDGYCNPLGTGVAEDPDYAGMLAHGDLA